MCKLQGTIENVWAYIKQYEIQFLEMKNVVVEK